MTYPRIVRSCECHNGHVWQGPVVFSKGTDNMPGMEEDLRCPFCKSIAEVNSEWRIELSEWQVMGFDRTYLMGANPTPFGAENQILGCGKPIHVRGTNGGTMPCGQRFTHMDGAVTTELCDACGKGTA